MIKKGAIISVTNNGKNANIQVSTGEVIPCSLFYPYGDVSNITVDNTSLALVIYPCESKNNPIAIPFNIPLQPTDLASGEKVVGNFKVGNKITFKANGDIEISADGDLNITADTVDASQDVNVGGVYKVANIQVVTSQQPQIIDPAGGVVIDVEARTAIISILAAMRTHGLIQP